MLLYMWDFFTTFVVAFAYSGEKEPYVNCARE